MSFGGAERSARMPRILLAEDDEAVRDMLRESLERDGFEVVAVGTVRDAPSCIAAENFDLLLSDLHIPCAVSKKVDSTVPTSQVRAPRAESPRNVQSFSATS